MGWLITSSTPPVSAASAANCSLRRSPAPEGSPGPEGLAARPARGARLNLVREPGAPAWAQRTAARFTTRPALDLCCRRERAGLPLTGMVSS